MNVIIKQYRKIILSIVISLIVFISGILVIQIIRNNNAVKILVIYHKKAPLQVEPYNIPIHAGRAIAKTPSKDGLLPTTDLEWLTANMIGDDTGDNISHLNRYTSEVSVIYWA